MFMLVLKPFLKPVCTHGINPRFSKYGSIFLNTSTSIILTPIGNKEIGLYEAGSLAGLSFLSIGTTMASFQIGGISPFIYISFANSKSLYFPPPFLNL